MRSSNSLSSPCRLSLHCGSPTRKKATSPPCRTFTRPSPSEAGRQAVSCFAFNRDLWQLKRHPDWRKLFSRRTSSNLQEARPRCSLYFQGSFFQHGRDERRGPGKAASSVMTPPQRLNVSIKFRFLCRYGLSARDQLQKSQTLG